MSNTDRPKGESIRVRVDDSTRRRLNLIATKKGVSLSDLIRGYIERGVASDVDAKVGNRGRRFTLGGW